MMPRPELLPGTPEFLIRLPKGGEARGHLLSEFGGNGTNKFLLREGSLVTAEEWPGLGGHARRFRAELRADGALVDAPAAPGRAAAARARWVGTRDSECSSPSAGAALVYGSDASGPESWRRDEGHPLSDYPSTGWRPPHKAWLVRGSNVSGHNLVRQQWLKEGLVSLSGAHLPPLEESDPTKSALRRFVEEGYEGAASYHQKQDRKSVV